MKRMRPITASELAESCMCEQRVVFDHLRGKQRTSAGLDRMAAGTAAHAELHREALDEAALRHQGDARCCIATASLGHTDPRTKTLLEWRDRWLLKQRWGPTVSSWSPLLVAVIVGTARLQTAVYRALSACARRRRRVAARE